MWVGIILAVVLVIINIVLACMKHINIVNSGLFGLIVGILLWNKTEIHLAFICIIGLAVLGLTLWLQQGKVGFWLISPPMSVMWGAFPASIIYSFTEDKIWLYVVWVAAFLLNMGLHLAAKGS